MSKIKLITSDERYKFLLSEIDNTEPYRLTCPTLFQIPQTFANRAEAFRTLEEVREQGHQSILSYVDVKRCKIIIVGYSAPSIFKRRKAG